MRRLSFISVLIAILVGILISVQVSYEDLGNFVFDFVPAIPTETMCYYSTIHFVEHMRSHSFSTETPFDPHISLLQNG